MLYVGKKPEMFVFLQQLAQVADKRATKAFGRGPHARHEKHIHLLIPIFFIYYEKDLTLIARMLCDPLAVARPTVP